MARALAPAAVQSALPTSIVDNVQLLKGGNMKKSALAPRYVTLEEAAEYLRLSRDTVRRMIRRQELSARKVGRSIRVEVASLEAVGKPLGFPGSQ